MVCAHVRTDNPRALAWGFSIVQAHKCTMISSVDLAHYGVSRTKDLLPVDYGSKNICSYMYHFTERSVFIRASFII